MSASDETSDDDKITVRYHSDSYSASVALRHHIGTSQKFGPTTEIKLEACMSASAPLFEPPVIETPEVTAPPETPLAPTLTPEELKQQQISQLYQYYNSLIVQQDSTFIKELVRMPRLGNPNHFSSAKDTQEPKENARGNLLV